MNIVHQAYAAITNPILPITKDISTNPYGPANSVIQTVFSLFFVVAVLYFFYFIFLAGFHWIDSEGDPKKVENSKNQFLYGIVGLTVIFCVFAILKVVGIVFGIPGLGSLEITWPKLQ